MADIIDLAAARRARTGDRPGRAVAAELRLVARRLDADAQALRRQAQALAEIVLRFETGRAAVADEAARARAIGRQAALIGAAIEAGDLAALEALRVEVERLRALRPIRPRVGGGR